ncbi:hypothetical protein FOL47_000079 [Perkinsus chesapeaki]|uniref:Uncharacterized protein n=1 Tax=Perkinsus chesapeaki TaxID=330153 RepID=A0A7J6N4H8_PERCH|nr:hypothetical protein FOL47_000079 [Perkinsus chesapeaki]
MPIDPVSSLSMMGLAKATLLPLKLACAAGGTSSGAHVAAAPLVGAAHMIEPSSLAVKASAAAISGKAGTAVAATAPPPPQGQSILDNGHQHDFWWQVTHEGQGLSADQLKHPEAMGITSEDVPVSAVPNPYAMTTKPTGSMWGPWHYSQNGGQSQDMTNVIDQANQLTSSLAKSPALKDSIKMYQNMAAELKARHPEFGTFITKESTLASLQAPLAMLAQGATSDFIGTVSAGSRHISVISLLQDASAAVHGFCCEYGGSWMGMPAVVAEIMAS